MGTFVLEIYKLSDGVMYSNSCISQVEPRRCLLMILNSVNEIHFETTSNPSSNTSKVGELALIFRIEFYKKPKARSFTSQLAHGAGANLRFLMTVFDSP